jgi:hypothetical protein
MEHEMNDRPRGNRVVLRRWFAASLLVATGAMVKVADAGSVSQALVAEAPAVFVATSPVRILDTRPAPNGPIGVATSAKLGPNSSLDVNVAGAGGALPANATAALLNITLDQDATAQSFLTVWPTGEERPLTSANNAQPGLIAANSMLAKLGTNGSVSIYNQQGSVNVVIDVVGYLVPASSGAGLLVGSGAPSAATGTDGNYYLDGSNHILYGPKANGAWPVPGSSLNGLPGGLGRFNTAALAIPNPTTTGTPIPFATLGPVFGSFMAPTVASTPTTITTGLTGIFEVRYRLDISAAGAGMIQVYVNNTPQGSGTNIGAAVATQANDTVLVPANAGDVIQLRFTGAVGAITTTNTSSLVVTQLT